MGSRWGERRFNDVWVGYHRMDRRAEVLHYSVCPICLLTWEKGSVVWRVDRAQKTVLEQMKNNWFYYL